MCLRQYLAHPFAWGVWSMKIEGDLRDGKVALESLLAVMPDGTIITVGDPQLNRNIARKHGLSSLAGGIPEPSHLDPLILNDGTADASGASWEGIHKRMVYLVLDRADESFPYACGARYRLDVKSVSDLRSVGASEHVNFLKPQPRLVLEPGRRSGKVQVKDELSGAVAIPLMRVIRNADGSFKLDREYEPPSLIVWDDSRLYTDCNDLVAKVQKKTVSYSRELVQPSSFADDLTRKLKASDGKFSVELLVTVVNQIREEQRIQSESRDILHSLLDSLPALQSVLRVAIDAKKSDTEPGGSRGSGGSRVLGAHGGVHPWELFIQLRLFAGSLLGPGAAVDFWRITYDHDDPLTSFRAQIAFIDRFLEEKIPDKWQVFSLEREIRDEEEQYWLHFRREWFGKQLRLGVECTPDNAEPARRWIEQARIVSRGNRTEIDRLRSDGVKLDPVPPSQRQYGIRHELQYDIVESGFKLIAGDDLVIYHPKSDRGSVVTCLHLYVSKSETATAKDSKPRGRSSR